MRLNHLLFLTVFLVYSCKNTTPEVTEVLQFTTLFSSVNTPDIACYRIPALITTQNGNLIAAIDERVPSCADLRGNKDINIVIRTSFNNGDTWSEIKTLVDYPLGQSASDPSMILDETTGEIFMFFNYMDLKDAPDEYYLRYISSKDHGSTWSDTVDITDQITKPEWNKDFKFVTSGRGIQTHSGDLLHTLVNLERGLHVFGSKDHGQSWHLIDTPITPGDESKIVELSNGNWMVNSRVNKSGMRYIHTSDDQGHSWTTFPDSGLIDPSCNASLIRFTSVADGYEKDRLLFCNPASPDFRENLTLRISYDEGKTWKYSKTIYQGKAAYSSLTILNNGDIGIFFEKDEYKESVFTKVSLEWLTDGKDSLD
jgi:sialidase-1